MKHGDKLDLKILQGLILPSPLTVENFQELAGKVTVEEVKSGQVIFKSGAVDRKTVYLLEGDVSVNDENNQKSIIRSGTEMARKALVNMQPRKHTVIAESQCKITRIDSDLLDILATWDQISGIEVNTISKLGEDNLDDDWMTLLLREKAFMNVPPANIQAMFMKMEEVTVSEGQVVVKQGDEGDYYYFIRKGSASVSRLSKSGSEIKLAELSVGMAFGEEALASGSKRNASVAMNSNGSLMRLSANDFNSLLKEPMIKRVSMSEGKEIVSTGGSFLDVRLEDEFSENGLESAINIPLFMLRLELEKLDSTRDYVVYCDTGRRSSAAAFLLSDKGYNACLLDEGLLGHLNSSK